MKVGAGNDCHRDTTPETCFLKAGFSSFQPAGQVSTPWSVTFQKQSSQGPSLPLERCFPSKPQANRNAVLPSCHQVFVPPSYSGYSRDCHAVFNPSPLWNSIITLFAASSEILAGLCLCIAFLSLNDEVFPRALSTTVRSTVIRAISALL